MRSFRPVLLALLLLPSAAKAQDDELTLTPTLLEGTLSAPDIRPYAVVGLSLPGLGIAEFGASAFGVGHPKLYLDGAVALISGDGMDNRSTFGLMAQTHYRARGGWLLSEVNEAAPSFVQIAQEEQYEAGWTTTTHYGISTPVPENRRVAAFGELKVMDLDLEGAEPDEFDSWTKPESTTRIGAGLRYERFQNYAFRIESSEGDAIEVDKYSTYALEAMLTQGLNGTLAGPGVSLGFDLGTHWGFLKTTAGYTFGEGDPADQFELTAQFGLHLARHYIAPRREIDTDCFNAAVQNRRDASGCVQ